jgi:hypothetical protein
MKRRTLALEPASPVESEAHPSPSAGSHPEESRGSLERVLRPVSVEGVAVRERRNKCP